MGPFVPLRSPPHLFFLSLLQARASLFLCLLSTCLKHFFEAREVLGHYYLDESILKKTVDGHDK